MSTARPTVATGTLVLADISGYTAFLQLVMEQHRDDAFANGAVPDAYLVVSSLLDGIVACLVPPFTLSKLEGDAVFAFSSGPGPVPRGTALLAALAGCHAGFRDRLGLAHQTWTCPCAACARIDDLNVKFVVHAGSFVLQEIAGRQELAGPDVVMVHRLLKNHAAQLVGTGSYVLVTDAAAALLDVPGDGGVRCRESYEHYAPISGYAFPLVPTP